MKFITTTALMLSLTSLSFAEGVGIAETEITADSSAMLEVASTNKGALFPRMTTAQRLAIPSPATGLLVFDTDEDTFFYKGETEWVSLSSPEEPTIAFQLNHSSTISYNPYSSFTPNFSVGFNEGNCITNGTQFVAPESGIYQLNASASVAAGTADSTLTLVIKKNGSIVNHHFTRSEYFPSITHSKTYKLNAGDVCVMELNISGSLARIYSNRAQFSGHLVKSLE